MNGNVLPDKINSEHIRIIIWKSFVQGWNSENRVSVFTWGQIAQKGKIRVKDTCNRGDENIIWLGQSL
jgi:hypothetical protein